MIQQKAIGWDVDFRCEACNITDNFYTADKDFIFSYIKAHSGHEGNVKVNTRLLEYDPDYVSRYACNGCEECNDV